jgi:hypothetical protein
MQLMKQFTRRLNLYICPETYAKIEQEAENQGRKTGNYARRLLDEWAMNREKQPTGRRDKKYDELA